MEILDQSEVDSLLNTPSHSGGVADQVEAESAAGASEPRYVDHLPPGFELKASSDQLKRIEPLRVPVIVRLAERAMSIDQILNVSVGTILEFDRPSDAELDLVVNNVVIGTGNAVKCGENFGLRIIKIQPWAQRLAGAGLFR